MSQQQLIKLKPEIVFIRNDIVYGRFFNRDTGGIKEEVILNLSARPQILIHEHSKMLAVFLDEESYLGIIKLIKSLKSGEDFGIIEMAKLWKQLKPMLEKMEIKNT